MYNFNLNNIKNMKSKNKNINNNYYRSKTPIKNKNKYNINNNDNNKNDKNSNENNYIDLNILINDNEINNLTIEEIKNKIKKLEQQMEIEIKKTENIYNKEINSLKNKK